MDTLKKTRLLWRTLCNYRQQKTTLDTYPIRLWIESSLACNLQCPMCYNKELAADVKGIMELSLFKKIIDEASEFAGDVYLHHRGEPLLNKQLPEMIRYARNAGLRVRFHTNATLLTQEWAESIISSGVDFLSVSFDGFQKDIYEEVRKGADFEQTVANITGLLRLKKTHKRRSPYVVIEKIDLAAYRDRVQPETVRRLAEMFKAEGVDEIIEKKEYEWTVSALPDRESEQCLKACTFPWYAMVVCWDGTVTPCPQDFMIGMNMGNLKDTSIRQIWNSKAYRELRRALTADRSALTLCRKCDRLCRKQVGGVPFQYLISFLSDQFIGYGRMRRMIGSFERN